VTQNVSVVGELLWYRESVLHGRGAAAGQKRSAECAAIIRPVRARGHEAAIVVLAAQEGPASVRLAADIGLRGIVPERRGN
jgi:DNA-binding NarL/FixJ family response regulator